MGKKAEDALAKAQAKDQDKREKYKDYNRKDEKFKNILLILKNVSDDMRIEAAGCLGNPVKAAKKRRLIEGVKYVNNIAEGEYEELKSQPNYKKAKKFYKRKAKEHKQAIKEHNKLVKKELSEQMAAVSKAAKELKEPVKEGTAETTKEA